MCCCYLVPSIEKVTSVVDGLSNPTTPIAIPGNIPSMHVEVPVL